MRRLFIGSSREGLKIAELLKEKVELKFNGILECNVWNDGKIFSLNNGTLDALLTASRKYDYGILIATADDIRKSRWRRSLVPRDNVMFEMGMFLGSLGLTRAFLLVEKSSTLPTDYLGVTVPVFDRKIGKSLENAIATIIDSIGKTLNSYTLKPVPAAALGLSYFDNFILKFAQEKLKRREVYKLEILIPQNLSEIRSSIDSYIAKNPSEEISIFDDGARPRLFKILNHSELYWDIPTTLSTLKKLMDIFHPDKEIGQNPDKQEWLDHEVRNFAGTLEVLIANSDACKEFVTVRFI